MIGYSLCYKNNSLFEMEQHNTQYDSVCKSSRFRLNDKMNKGFLVCLSFVHCKLQFLHFYRLFFFFSFQTFHFFFHLHCQDCSGRFAFFFAFPLFSSNNLQMVNQFTWSGRVNEISQANNWLNEQNEFPQVFCLAKLKEKMINFHEANQRFSG